MRRQFSEGQLSEERPQARRDMQEAPEQKPAKEARVSLRMTETLRQALERGAAAAGMRMSEYLREALRAHVARSRLG